MFKLLRLGKYFIKTWRRLLIDYCNGCFGWQTDEEQKHEQSGFPAMFAERRDSLARLPVEVRDLTPF
jgi:hypothetical protein